jgi:NADH-quinone oxidoreductase subunit K
MQGPEVSGYLVVAAFLFATGALGVLIRRSPLIVLSRHFGREDGQVFALAVMAVAASEVVVGLGLIVAMARRRIDLDVDKLSTLRG